MVLGKLTTESTQYGHSLTVAPIEGAMLADQLAEAIQHIEGRYTEAVVEIPDVADSDLTEQQEALLFAQQTGVSAPLTAGAKMRAKIYGGDPEAIAFQSTTQRAGFELSFTQCHAKWRIDCIATAFGEYAQSEQAILNLHQNKTRRFCLWVTPERTLKEQK